MQQDLKRTFAVTRVYCGCFPVCRFGQRLDELLKRYQAACAAAASAAAPGTSAGPGRSPHRPVTAAPPCNTSATATASTSETGSKHANTPTSEPPPYLTAARKQTNAQEGLRTVQHDHTEQQQQRQSADPVQQALHPLHGQGQQQSALTPGGLHVVVVGGGAGGVEVVLALQTRLMREWQQHGQQQQQQLGQQGGGGSGGHMQPTFT